MSIKVAMSEKGVSVEAVSKLLNIHRNTAANKIEGRTPFTINEAFSLKENLFAEYDLNYLFGVEKGA
jgi:plasmid maintenance system antidote protein VapI